jgi:hypothetical protein
LAVCPSSTERSVPKLQIESGQHHVDAPGGTRKTGVIRKVPTEKARIKRIVLQRIANMNNLPEPIQQQIAVAQISDLSMAESIASNFAPFMEEVQEQIELLKPLEMGNPEHVEVARRISIDLGRIRSRKDAIKKEQKDHYLKVGRFIDALSNTVEGMITLTQDEAKEHAKYFDNLEKQRIEKLKQDRIELISPYMESHPVGLELLNEETFQIMLSGAKATHAQKLEAIRIAEEQRIEKEKIEKLHHERREMMLPIRQFWPTEDKNPDFGSMSQKDFKKFMADTKKASDLYNEEQARIKAENERLRAEAEERAKAEKERIAREEAKREEESRILNLQHQRDRMLLRVNAHVGDEIISALGAMSEEDFQEIYAPAKQKYNELVAEQNRILHEQRVAEEQKKKLESASDKEKLLALIDDVKIDTVTTSTEEGLHVHTELVRKLDAYKNWARKIINDL